MTEAPYPADTRAKGWRFELDYEQIEQSDTWPLAAEIPMAQHALLMMWFVAWAQLPCGSLPNDEAVIRVKCKLPPTVWARCREVLMRGWWLASDDRLYHDTLTKRVLEMMARRRSDADRKAADRARKAAESAGSIGGVTQLSHVTPPGLHRESSTDNRQPNKEKKTGGVSDLFEEFWKAWPKTHRKEAKGKCAEVWKAKAFDGKAAAILAHVRARAASVDWTKEEGQFVPAPLVYLRRESWDGAELAEPAYAGGI